MKRRVQEVGRMVSLAAAFLVAFFLAADSQAVSRDYDYEARAASASTLAKLSLENGGGTPVSKEELCPCSVNGTCPCTEGNECGCLRTGKYRWVTTSNTNQTALYQGDRQLGNYWCSEGVYKQMHEDFDGATYWTVAICPVQCPTHGASSTVSYVSPAPTWTTVPTRPQTTYQRTYSNTPTQRTLFFQGSSRRGFGSAGSCGPGGC